MFINLLIIALENVYMKVECNMVAISQFLMSFFTKYFSNPILSKNANINALR